jgi:hypothetical protein
MRTTVTLSDEVFRAARLEAERRGTTLASLVEEAVRTCLEGAGSPDKHNIVLPSLVVASTGSRLSRPMTWEQIKAFDGEVDSDHWGEASNANS